MLGMIHRHHLFTWFAVGGALTLFSALWLFPAGASATPFASPAATPAASQLNQPYVTFQQQSLSQRLFRFNDGIPIYVVTLILLILLGLVILSLSSFRSKR